jgi:hypothetical protein
MSNDIERRIDETLDSLNGMERATASPWMYNKVLSKMKAEKEVPVIAYRWRMAAAAIVILLVNVATVVHMMTASQQNNNGIEKLATEYSISLPEIY